MALSQAYIRKINLFCDFLPKRMFLPQETVSFSGFFTYDRMTLAEAASHEKQPMPEGLAWGLKWEYGWFFADVTVPESCAGERILFTAPMRESTVFVNGKIFGALDWSHSHITLTDCAKGGETFHIVMETYAGHAGMDLLAKTHSHTDIPEKPAKPFAEDVTQKVIQNGSVGIFRTDIFHFWMDLQTLWSLRENLPEASLRRGNIDLALMRMCDTVNLELPMEEFREAVRMGRSILQPVLACKNGDSMPTFITVSHSHLDLEWLWTTAETRRKVARTLGNQLKLMEHYPDMRYLQSQAWILDTVKREYPDLYEDVRKTVADGRILPEGAAWVEPDTNIPCGESLVRQFLVGKAFYRDEFGIESKLFWLPDSFGVSGAIPQILKGFHIPYFASAKIRWLYNGGDRLPHGTFRWRGIDGSEVLSVVLDGYQEDPKPASLLKKWNAYPEKELAPVRLLPYGYGDGGGGSTEIHQEYLARLHDLEGAPKVMEGTPNDYFRLLETVYPIEKTYVGELYYAMHQGTYTSQAKTKKGNRLCEFALHDAELWSALLCRDTKAETDALWKTVLFNQFHDIIPGSSIAEVYTVAEQEYEAVRTAADRIATDSVASAVDAEQDTFTMWNSLGWDRQALVALPEGYTSAEDSVTQEWNGRVYAKFDVPACGCKSYRLGHKSAAETLQVRTRLLESEKICAEFNEKGELVRVTDKTNGMEYLSDVSNRFRMYQDMPTFSDAWDIDHFYEKTEISLDEVAEVSDVTFGPLFSYFTVRKQLHHSQMTQTVFLRHDSAVLEFRTEIDWNESHKLLKVDFNTNIQTEEIVSEIQFGLVKRPNHKSRPYDADRFEVSQQKWSALAEAKRGVAILNDCKYGISADGGRMSLTLLKSSQDPALFADQGHHSFTYALMPFDTSLADSDVTEASYGLNCPVRVAAGKTEPCSFLSVTEPNVVLETVKRAEDGLDDVIVRLYESKGGYTRTDLRFGFPVSQVFVTDMEERNLHPVSVSDGTARISLKAFEIITLRLKRI